MTTDRCLLWAPRVVGLGFVIALPVIGARSFQHGIQDPETIIALVMHLLLAALLLTLIITAWWKEWLGWVAAPLMLAFYIWTSGPAVPWNDTALILNGLPILGLLYAWNDVRHRRPSRPMPARSSAEFPLFASGEAPRPRRSSGGYRPAAAVGEEGRPRATLILLTRP